MSTEKRPAFARADTDNDHVRLGVENLGMASHSADGPKPPVATINIAKEVEHGGSDVASEDNRSPDMDKPHGVRVMEAITMVWSKQWLFAAYGLIWLIYVTDSLQQQAGFSWTPYVTSAFQLHSLTATTGIVAQLISGIFKFPIAKFIDIVGRTQGFIFMLIATVLSLIMMAACNNVETYAAAQVFYWTGLNSMGFVMNMFINDTSKLRNRTIALTFSSTPYIFTAFAGPAVAQAFLDHSTWRWGFGAFAIITPVMCAPFLGLLWILIRRTKKQGIYQRPKSGRTWWQSTRFYLVEFDVIGLLLICGGFSILLLPFSLAAYQSEGWRSPMIICMIVFGVVIVVLFGLWERFFAPKPFFPFHLLTNKDLILACLIDANIFVAYSLYSNWWYSYLQVVFQLSVEKAGWLGSIYNIVSCGWGVPLAIMFKYTNRFKWAALISAPGYILFTGLFIYFRSPATSVSLLILSQFFQSLFTASLIITAGLALQASVPHEHLAVALALQGTITSVGGSIGAAVSGAMWTQLFIKYLQDYLPADVVDQAFTIYGDLEAQLSYPWGSPARDAIVQAYGDAYKWMLVAATCLLTPLLLWVVMLKNYKLSDHKNLKGTLF